MDASEIRESMRQHLRAEGLYPTERGVQQARRNQKRMRQELREAADRLEPADLFSAWLVVETLTREDAPEPDAPAKRKARKG